MKKLKLDLTKLNIESFVTAPVNKKSGTVIGNDKPTKYNCLSVDIPCLATIPINCNTNEQHCTIVNCPTVEYCPTRLRTCNECTDNFVECSND